MQSSSSLQNEGFALELSHAAAPYVGSGRVLESFGEPKTLQDATSTFLVRDDVGNPELVILCSAAGGLEGVARAVKRARATVAALGTELGSAVLLPLQEGQLDGRSFAIFSYCTPLVESGPRWWIQRSVVRPRLVRWLLDASRATVKAVPTERLGPGVAQPLENMIADEGHPPDLRALAEEALRALHDGQWIPKHVFTHGDLWVGNVLIDQRSPGGSRFGRFVIIDWAGAQVQGYPYYDLLRLACSFALSGKDFFRALRKYDAALGYRSHEGRYAFAAAAAELGQRLEHWPRKTYLSTIERCYQKLVSGR